MEMPHRLRLLILIAGSFLAIELPEHAWSQQPPPTQIDEQNAANQAEDTPNINRDGAQLTGHASTEDKQNAQNTPAQLTKENDSPDGWLAWLDSHAGSVQAIFAGLLVLLTALYVVFTVKLWRATKGTADTAQTQARISWKALILGQRARVSVDPAGIETTTFDELIGQVVFVNTGHMPASEFKWRIKIIAQGRGDWIAEEISSSDLEGNAVLPVGARWNKGSPPCNPRPEMPTDYVYVYGRVEYTDGFNGRRHTNFCHRYTWARKQLVALNLIEGGSRVETKIDVGYARFHKNGNEAN